ncbi:glycosyltransferase family 4 protein [Pedobacter aquatilis]|uniref:glycosyltransferase family 4 protein n=1 Tax=Pedobacter aquatilis TaxID=351343 RepID=UPI00293085C9|nr:glycosyltransferase family 4 protein [Pedobacter aquatilis]
MTKISDINTLNNALIHSTPSVGKFSTETLKAYDESGALKYMFTTLVVHPENIAVKYLTKIFPFVKAKLKNRYFSEIPLKKIKLYPYKELCRLFAVKFLNLTAADSVWEWAELSFDKWVSNKLDKDVRIVHCYEHAALLTFKKAQKSGCFKILEQVSQHHTYYGKMASEQFKLYPSLRSRYNEKISLKGLHKRNQRKDEEYDLADLIICNSTFTMKTLIDAGIEHKKILKIPLAYPEVSENKVQKKKTHDFTFMYAGSLSLTKGTHILLEIWLKYFSDKQNIRLILAGSNSLPKEFTEDLPKNVELMGFLNKKELDNLYNQADLLVFPTLADGFGMVITEAMAKGLPVLTTNNSAGNDLIDDGKDGFIVDAGNLDALAEKMCWIVKNRSILDDMSKLIIEKARKYQWSDYRKLLIAEVEKRYLEFHSDKVAI